MLGNISVTWYSRGQRFKMAAKSECSDKSLNDFMKWKVDDLKAFLKERGVVINGRKAELAEKVYFASKLKLEALKKKEEVEIDNKVRRCEKLTIDCGIKLPFPANLTIGWERGSQNFPDVLEKDVENYMQKSFKAMKQGQSLLTSNHIHDVMFHHISTNVKYCFVRGCCVPEEKTSNESYSLWVCVHKESGEVLTAECTCFAG
ncbi:uncharacterized protein LOC110232620 [Exaiptasia diaphana]|uniref:SAP domain-containing protein n=1 Tax=Exaiptasia diaphana TaxID=2652724 RepID=A0A913WSM8_EXADI|nr:uncharacterized protein LOC110232620 [Exaiptasia diaphana]